MYVLYRYSVTINLIHCLCYHGAAGLLEAIAVFCFAFPWRHNNFTLRISSVWRMTRSLTVVQPPGARFRHLAVPYHILKYQQNCREYNLECFGNIYIKRILFVDMVSKVILRRLRCSKIWYANWNSRSVQNSFLLFNILVRISIEILFRYQITCDKKIYI